MTIVRREGYKFCQDICIPCYNADVKALLKPASFMDFAQEIAYWAANELGFGYDTLHIHHTAWVLSRMHVHFEEPLAWRDQVVLQTWHKGANGLFYLRDFDLKDKDGKSRIIATSSWVVIDERTRRLVRPEDLKDLLDPDMQVDNAIEEPAPKIVLPKDVTAEKAGEHTVSYSDLDLNGHTNNPRYVVWSMDVLPAEVTEKPVKDLFINFIKETKLGEKVELFRIKTQDAWYVEGKVEDKTCFLVKMEFQS